MKMTAADKKAWLDALRSGKYMQGEGYLHFQRLEGPESFCCLGVLCEIQGLEGIDLEAFIVDAGYPIAYEGRCSELPASLVARFQCDEAQFEQQTVIGKLMTMNDDLGKSFNEIADYLETTIEVIESYPS